MTVLNFAAHPLAAPITSSHLPPGSTVTDMSTDTVIGAIDRDHSLVIQLASHQGRSLLMSPADV
jgi:hypothetical protein